MIDSSIMPFGRHKGKHMHQVPNDYLLWLYEEMKVKKPYGSSKLVWNYLVDNLDVIGG